MAGYKVKGPSTSLPGAFDVETDDGRVFPVAPSGLPEYEAPPEIGPTVGEPTAYGDVMTIGRETVLDAGGAQPGLPPQAGGELPRLPMPPRAPRGPRPAPPATLVRNEAPPPAQGAAPPQAPMVDADAPPVDPASLVTMAANIETEIGNKLGRGRYTGPPTTATQTMTEKNRIMSPEAQAQHDARMAAADQAAAEAQAANDRAVELEAKSMRDRAEALRQAEEAAAEKEARDNERMDMLTREADAIRREAVSSDERAEELESRYGTADTFRRLAGAIGMFLSGPTGNPMGMIQFINANADAEWERDMAKLQSARGKGDKMRSRAAELIDEAGDIGAAKARYRAEFMAAATAKGERLALQSGSQQLLEKNEALKAAGAAEINANIAQAIKNEAPVVERTVTQKERSGGVVGGPSKRAVDFVYGQAKEQLGEQRAARGDVRKAGLDMQRDAAKGQGEGGSDAAFRKQIVQIDGAVAGMRSLLSQSKKNGGLFSGNPNAAEKAAAAQRLKDAGLDELANTVKDVKSRAEFDSILASGMAAGAQRGAATMATAPASARMDQKKFERASAGAAGDFSKMGGAPRKM